jgi:molecular chaperone DnaK
LTDIPPAPRGVPQVEVTFDIDANGIVHVSAKDLGTGKEQKIRIEASSGLSESDIDRMVKDAESHADEDRKRKEEIALFNQADSQVFAVEKLLKEHGEKAPADAKREIEEAVAAVKKALEKKDAEAVKSGLDRLNEVTHKMTSGMYGQPGAGAAPGGQQAPGAASGGPADDVVDAEFEVNDEKKD